MPIDWLDVTHLSFQSILLFERIQLTWFPGWRFPEPAMSLALEANPAVAWFVTHKCPEAGGWVASELERAAAARGGKILTTAEIREVEVAALGALVDLLVYAVDPEVYDRLPFLGWDSNELTGLLDFRGKRVLDIGAGTGRLAFAVSGLAQAVWAVEPVANLRGYMKDKARRLGLNNFYAVDGIITAIPFPNGFADVVICGHVFGDDLEEEHAEMARVTCPGGSIILCPGNNDRDDESHAFLVEHGYQWSVFIEPPADPKRKYWLKV
ncbi:MAG: class I SAM-dependent methyltransferase [Anaerolineaceae bacterium]|nr:class I SAM-dependent methyltransferase [Anaerolineaceae bacterium]